MLKDSTLQGFRISDVNKKMITMLFANDITVFLNKNDVYKILTSVLDLWCIASTAHFNTTKTEIIPIGSPTFHSQVITTRHL